MTDLLIAWLISLPPVFLVGWAWGRSSRRPVIVNFPARPLRRPRTVPGRSRDHGDPGTAQRGVQGYVEGEG